MRNKILLLTAVVAVTASAPEAAAAGSDVGLDGQASLVQMKKGQAELTFTTDAALPRRSDGRILASAKVARGSYSIGKFVKATGDPRRAVSGRSYVVYVKSTGLRVGTHIPVTISIDGQDPIRVKVTLARKYWK
jgi:hypothetical protein